MDNLETIIGVLLGAGGLCVALLFGGGLFFLINLKNRSLRRAAQSWRSTTGRVLDTRVAPRVYFWRGITEAEAGALVRKWKAENEIRPEDMLGAFLSLFGTAGELAGDLVAPARGGVDNLDEWPMVVYEYAVDGVKYIGNRLRVEDTDGPTKGGGLYTRKLFKRYPKGAAVTVYFNPGNPKESALER